MRQFGGAGRSRQGKTDSSQHKTTQRHLAVQNRPRQVISPQSLDFQTPQNIKRRSVEIFNGQSMVVDCFCCKKAEVSRGPHRIGSKRLNKLSLPLSPVRCTDLSFSSLRVRTALDDCSPGFLPGEEQCHSPMQLKTNPTKSTSIRAPIALLKCLPALVDSITD